ncbi:CoA transferase [Streptomyces lichenis]|uniref:CoA transferase n=1 Tax=Streptomyces lichenis TaxID=2306967 RepID=A0ABT0ICB7_9ACTN|nr:CoA transferase [Streptomyces lichenis]MCK8678966.1 CoA transferase [Streptomyces lichenis]
MEPREEPVVIGGGAAGAWRALDGGPALLDRVTYVAAHRDGVPLPARLPVRELARSAVAVCSLAAAELAATRAGRRSVPPVTVDDGAVAAAFVSDRLVRLDGRAWDTFAPLSRFWRASDGFVRTHANYPHHRARLLAALGLPDGGDALPALMARAVAARTAEEVEEAVYAAGGLAVAVRSPGRWAAGEQGALLAGQPLTARERTGGSLPLPAGGTLAQPCAGVRVLDLTRVLAGPVATRTLALLGAEVLRIDAPFLPESQEAHNDTGLGKRSALLDLGRTADRRTFEDLLGQADVVVTGYRPGALDRFGLGARELAAARPGLVVAELSAWGRQGPWRGRRGFDSLVQAATGIAELEGSPAAPGALPAQALDHGTGYLLAAAVLRSLTERHQDGGGALARLTLARTAHWLLRELRPEHAPAAVPPGMDDREGDDPGRWMLERTGPLGVLGYARSPVSYQGGPVDWARPSGRWGADPARWTDHG